MTEVIVRPLSLAGTVLGGAIHVITWPFAVLGGQDTTESRRQLINKPLEATFKRPLGDFTRLYEINRGKHQPVDRSTKTALPIVVLGQPSASTPTPTPVPVETPPLPTVKPKEKKPAESKEEEPENTAPVKPSTHEEKPDEQKKPGEIKPNEETTEPKKEIPAPIEPPANPETKNENPETPAPLEPSTNPENPDKETKPEAKDPLKDGLIAYYPFNGNANDETGSGNNGEVKGATLGTDRHGHKEKAYSFDGKDDYLQMKSPIFSTDPGSHSISLWFKPNQRDGDILSDRHGASCNYKYRIYFTAVGPKELGNSVAWTIFEERVNQKDLYIQPIALDKWMMVSCTYNLKAGVMTVFMNGKKVSERKHFNAWSSLPNPTTIGALFGCAKYGSRQPEGFYKGSVDDLRFYNRALSAEEVKALHELEKPKAEKKEDSEKPAEVKPSEEIPEPKKESPAPIEPPTNPETPDEEKKPAEVKPSEESPEPKKETPAPVEPKVYQSPSGKAYPAHWGAPPLLQTRDLRPLPGGYGNGSGTLARWIQENLDKDAQSKTEDPDGEKKPAEIKPSEKTPSPTEPEEEKKPTQD